MSMGRILNCPRCQKDAVLQTLPQSIREHFAAVVFMAPFKCLSCSHRFLASRLWLDQPTHPMDRREHLRIPVRLYLSFSGGKVRGEGTVLDLSMGGCIIKSETLVHTDDIFYLQLALSEGDLPLEVAAMVRSVSPRGIAFKFLRAAQENKRLLAFVQAQIPDQPGKSSSKVAAAA
ncbi:MAG: PilZ domain-containing protein [Nitrospirota bacterium]|nr:PilZ domain-containing protein [Nitrospirota bacterium]MDP2384291.1 PilZ domain-containing protein [Nitrospirota bacterium]MDP3596513.1 PilZ domain-containing protein [Nitrospirota bacterium]